MTSHFYSPLRYPGGKGKVSDYFKQIFKDNYLYDGVYVEPYTGGASVALSLLFNEYVSKIIINDIDRSIYAFWHSVLNKPDELCKLIRDTRLSPKVWDTQREIQKNKKRQNLLQLGFSTFYLNRTNRSGIISGGMIGGRQQDGKWKMDARFNKPDLINRIERIAQHKSKIELHNLDAVELTDKLSKSLPKKSLFYFDPPYCEKGKDLYLNFYEYKDHQQVAIEIEKVKNQKWIVTYDDVYRIRKLYSEFRKRSFNLSYSTGGANKQGKEVMIFSDNLYISRDPIFKSKK